MRDCKDETHDGHHQLKPMWHHVWSEELWKTVIETEKGRKSHVKVVKILILPQQGLQLNESRAREEEGG